AADPGLQLRADRDPAGLCQPSPGPLYAAGVRRTDLPDLQQPDQPVAGVGPLRLAAVRARLVAVPPAGLPRRGDAVPLPPALQPGRLARGIRAAPPYRAGRPGMRVLHVYERYFGRLIYGVFAFILFAVL